ncbi:MAG: hypothetical protein ACRDYY_05755 [Acidimicrobiales bacterium]
MLRRLLRLAFAVAVVAGAALVLRAALKRWVDGPAVEPPAAPWPDLVGAPAPPTAPWVDPPGDGPPPPTHPVKVKLSSKLYHLPGMAVYERTRPDRCYATAEAAEADGFLRAKR